MVELLLHYSNPALSSKLQVIQGLLAQGATRDGVEPAVRRRMRRLTAAETDELITRYREHIPVKELAAAYGITRQTVSEILRRRGVERHQRGLSPADVTEAVRLYQEGWSLARLGRKFWVDDMTVRRYLLLAGVVMRSQHDHSGNGGV